MKEATSTGEIFKLIVATCSCGWLRTFTPDRRHAAEGAAFAHSLMHRRNGDRSTP